jgi:hypothetical protein
MYRSQWYSDHVSRSSTRGRLGCTQVELVLAAVWNLREYKSVLAADLDLQRERWKGERITVGTKYVSERDEKYAIKIRTHTERWYKVPMMKTRPRINLGHMTGIYPTIMR